MITALPKAWMTLVEEEDLLLELLADRVESLCGYKPDPDTVAVFLKSSVTLRQGEPLSNPLPAKPKPQLRIEGRSDESQESTRTPVGASSVGFNLNGQHYRARNSRGVLIAVFKVLADRDASFLERFAALPKHGRTRRYLARTPDELYPGRSDLAREFSVEVKAGWWLFDQDLRVDPFLKPLHPFCSSGPDTGERHRAQVVRKRQRPFTIV